MGHSLNQRRTTRPKRRLLARSAAYGVLLLLSTVAAFWTWHDDGPEPEAGNAAPIGLPTRS